jgi:tetratricopeptide (TPR) repeat protein
MDILLSLAARISREFAFSAFALALLMLLSYWTINNPKVLKIVGDVLNKRLKESNLYKFIRLGIILVFTFSVLVVLLSFLSPLTTRLAENRSLELLVAAREKFSIKDYTEARVLYKNYLDINPDIAGADEIRGMITATYYGQGLHEEGLQFICKQYRGKAAADRVFLFNVHAHIRAISVAKGKEVAEAAARRLRQDCDREDYSEFWAHIPFGMMESLRRGRLRSEHAWVLDETSKARLLALLAGKRRSALSNAVPLTDFVLYFTDQFDELIRTMPDSPIRDMALFDAANFSHGAHAVDYLKLLVEQHPRSARYQDALIALVGHLGKLNRRDEALAYLARLKKSESLDRAAYLALQPTIMALERLIGTADFAAALQITNDICKKSEALSLPCYAKVAAERANLNRATEAIAALPQPEDCLAVHQRLRPLSRDGEKNLARHWVQGMRSRLIACLPDLQNTAPEHYPRALYLIGLLSRRLNEYDMSMQYLARFDREVEDNDLKDDVIAEMAYHKLIIEKDWPAARPLLERVISGYPQRNAYDNAVWWYAKGMKQQGEYASAIGAYLNIAQGQAASRFRAWSQSEANHLEKFSKLSPFVGVALRTVRREGDAALHVAAIEDSSPVAKLLRTGDRLVQICGRNIYDIEQLLAIVAADGDNPACKVVYLRDAQLFVFSRQDNGWNIRRAQLTKELREQLAFGQAIL